MNSSFMQVRERSHTPLLHLSVTLRPGALPSSPYCPQASTDQMKFFAKNFHALAYKYNVQEDFFDRWKFDTSTGVNQQRSVQAAKKAYHMAEGCRVAALEGKEQGLSEEDREEYLACARLALTDEGIPVDVRLKVVTDIASSEKRPGKAPKAEAVSGTWDDEWFGLAWRGGVISKLHGKKGSKAPTFDIHLEDGRLLKKVPILTASGIPIIRPLEPAPVSTS